MATIEISNYQQPAEAGDVPPTATLVTVKNIIQPASCARGNGQ